MKPYDLPNAAVRLFGPPAWQPAVTLSNRVPRKLKKRIADFWNRGGRDLFEHYVSLGRAYERMMALGAPDRS